MHRDAHLCLFTFIFLALTGVIAGTPNPVNFPPVWMVFIIYVATIPITASFWDNMARKGDDIMHFRWMNDLTLNWPDALPRDMKLMSSINYGVKQTCFRIVLGITFVACGIKYRQNVDRRVMTVLGILWLLELLLRWALEITYNHYWKVNTPDTHPVIREIMFKSRLTRWCRKLFGWPKSSINEDTKQNKEDPLYDWMLHVWDTVTRVAYFHSTLCK
jgi:hypothetical protein